MSDGKFGSKKLTINDDLEQGNNDDDGGWEDEIDLEKDVTGEGWGDDDDSGWEDEINL